LQKEVMQIPPQTTTTTILRSNHQPQNNNDVATNTVFVEGIPFTASRDDVQQFFCQRLQLNDIVEMRLPTFQYTGRLRGFGHIQLVSSAAYHVALSMSGQHLGSRYLTIQPTKELDVAKNSSVSLPFPPPKGCRTLFVHNLPYDATESDISTVFDQVSPTNGIITEEHVRIVRNSVTRQSKGFAYVDFDSTDQLKTFVQSITTGQQQSLVVGGRTVRLDYDTGRIKGSFRADSGRLWTKEKRNNKNDHEINVPRRPILFMM
jgi:nucleolin